MEEKETYYFIPPEKNTHCSGKIKRFIANVILLCAIGMPRYNTYIRFMFNVKIVAWLVLLTKQWEITKLTCGSDENETCCCNKRTIHWFPWVKTKFSFQMNKTALVQQDSSWLHIEQNKSSAIQARLSGGSLLNKQLVG